MIAQVEAPSLKLTSQQRKQLRLALLSAYPSRIKLQQLVYFELGENLSAISAPGDLGDTVYQLIRWAEAQGRTKDLIIKAHESTPGNPQVADLLALLNSPAQGQIQPVNQGFEALSQLLANKRVRGRVFGFRDNFSAARTQLVLLGDYKDLHDVLHVLQRDCYDVIVQAAERFPAEAEAADNLRDYSDTLRRHLNEVKAVADRKSLAARDATDIFNALDQARAAHLAALDRSDPLPLRRAIRLLNSVLSIQPTRIDKALNDAAGALQLPELLAAMTVLRDQLVQLKLDAEKVEQFQAGVAALADLDKSLHALIKTHYDWQGVDVKLRRIEFSLDQGFEELEFFWTELKDLTRPLCEGNADQWGPEFLAAGDKLDEALAVPDPVQIKKYFKRYRRQAGDRFFDIDKSLKEQCGALRTIGEPLDLVLRMIA